MDLEKRKKLGIWALAFTLFFVHVVFRSVAHAEESRPWKAISAKKGECQIEFPSPPQWMEQSIPVAEGGQKLHYDLYLAPFEDRGVFLLMIATYPMPLSKGHEIVGLEGLVKGIVGHSPDNALLFAHVVDFSGLPAVNFLVQNTRSYFRGQAVMVGNQLFLVAMEGKQGTLHEATFARFLQSFRLQK